MRYLILILISLFTIACGSGGEKAPDTSDKKERLDLSLDPSLGNVILPSPGEIFTALDNLDKVNWAKLSNYSTRSDYSTRYAQALNLGIRIADGFVAVNEESQVQCYKMNGVIEQLATQLGFGEYMKMYKDSLTIPIATGQWKKARTSLDNLHFAVQDKISLKGEKDIVVLGGIGGWLEGLYVVSGHLNNNFKKENCDLLNQGRLLKQYRDDLSSLNLSDPLVEEVSKGLAQIQDIIGTEDTADKIGFEQVTQLHTISKALTAKIINAK